MNWTGHSHMKSSETKISYQCEISSETAKNVEVVFQTRIEELSNLGCSVAAFRFLALAAVIAESAHAAEEGYSFRDVCLGPSQRKGLPCQGCTTGKQGCVRTRWRCVRPHDETARNTHTKGPGQARCRAAEEAPLLAQLARERNRRRRGPRSGLRSGLNSALDSELDNALQGALQRN